MPTMSSTRKSSPTEMPAAPRCLPSTGATEKTDHVWHVHQIFADEDGDHDFGIMGDVDLDATQDGGEVIFKNYRVGFIEDLLED